jgi:hypothetical protein
MHKGIVLCSVCLVHFFSVKYPIYGRNVEAHYRAFPYRDCTIKWKRAEVKMWRMSTASYNLDICSYVTSVSVSLDNPVYLRPREADSCSETRTASWHLHCRYCWVQPRAEWGPSCSSATSSRSPQHSRVLQITARHACTWYFICHA